MDKHLREVTDFMYFLTLCIEQYMNAKELEEIEVIDIFTKYEVIDFLNENIEVLRNKSSQLLVEEIDDFINKRNEKQN